MNFCWHMAMAAVLLVGACGSIGLVVDPAGMLALVLHRRSAAACRIGLPQGALVRAHR